MMKKKPAKELERDGRLKRRSFLAGLGGAVGFAALSSRFSGAANAQAGPAREHNSANPDVGSGPKTASALGLAHMPKVLAIGDVRTGYQHDSVSHALATIERLGRQTGTFVTYIRTDSQLITKGPVYGTGKYAAPPVGTRRVNAKTLRDFDAIFFYGIGEGDLSAAQKADLLSFVHDDGNSFVGAHSAIDAFYSWPEYGEMIGGYFDNHPWGVMDAPVIVEQPSFPGMSLFPKEFVTHDEIYVVTDKPYSREKVDVLASLDPGKINLSVPDLHRTDRDFPVAWVKPYGRGRVFYSTLGHTDAAWDDPGVQHMYLEAIKWALRRTEYTPRPHPRVVKRV